MSRFDPVRPSAAAGFYKAHGLGNDYLIFEEGESWALEARAVRRVCHRQGGVGSDGVVVVLAPTREPFTLRMFNPDGSEFERSGNGLRVLASWLHRTGRVKVGQPFEVQVGGDRISMTVHGRTAEGVYDVSVQMGRARTGLDAVALDPAALHPDPSGRSHGVLDLGDPAGGDGGTARGQVPVHLVRVGNPHCVVFTEGRSPGTPAELPGPQGGPGPPAPYAARGGALRGVGLDRALLQELGPVLATHPAFPRGTNVQLAQVVAGERPRAIAVGGVDWAEVPATSGGVGGPTWPRIPRPPAIGAGGGVVRALIWERGVGRTTASGTSACAVAVAAVTSGQLHTGTVEVRMEGGSLFVGVRPGLDVVLRGPVDEVMTGELGEGFLEALRS